MESCAIFKSSLSMYFICYVYLSKIKNFIVQSLSMSLFINPLLEPDSYSNEYLVAKIGVGTAENESSYVCQER